MAHSNPRRILHELRGKAWEAELEQALNPIAERFDAWRRGEASAFELVDAIHQFHQGDSREIWKKYQLPDTEYLLALALEDGLLQRTQVPDAIYAHLLPHVEQVRASRAHWKLINEARPEEEDADDDPQP